MEEIVKIPSTIRLLVRKKVIKKKHQKQNRTLAQDLDRIYREYNLLRIVAYRSQQIYI